MASTAVDVARLDPGNIVELDFDSDAFRDNWLALAAEWAQRPPFYVIDKGVPQIIVGRYAEVKEVLLSPERFTSTPPPSTGARLDPFFGIPTFVRQNGPAHDRLRRTVQPWFGGAAAARVEDSIERHVHEVIDELEAKGNPVDLVEDFAAQLMPRIMLDEMFGLSAERRAAFQAMKEHLDASVVAGEFTPEYIAAYKRMRQVIDEIIAEREEQPNPTDFIGAMVAARQTSDDPVTDDEIAGPVFGICAGGIGTTTSETTHVLHRWLRNRDDFEVLREEPGLIHQALDEAVRLHPTSLFVTPRFVVEDTVLGGTPLYAGMPLHVGVAAANLDPDIYPDPLRFDIMRKPKHILSFGAGPHFCVGGILAKKTMVASLRAFMDRHPNTQFADPGFTMRYQKGIIGELLPQELPVNLD